MFFSLVLTWLLVGLTPGQSQPIDEKTLKFQIIDSRTAETYEYKGIPDFVELANDEKREIYHYAQTLVVRDLGPDESVRRCAILEIYKDEDAEEALNTLQVSLNLESQQVTMDKMMKLMNVCDSIDDNYEGENDKEIDKEEIYDNQTENPPPNAILHGILPGTNWCGLGDRANGYHDLGSIRGVDRCCRAHDLCPIKILTKDTRYNLTNDAMYTQSHCMCDEAFYDCLKKDNGWTATFIGNLYFYVAPPNCIHGLPDNTEEKMEFVPATRKW